MSPRCLGQRRKPSASDRAASGRTSRPSCDRKPKRGWHWTRRGNARRFTAGPRNLATARKRPGRILFHLRIRPTRQAVKSAGHGIGVRRTWAVAQTVSSVKRRNSGRGGWQRGRIFLGLECVPNFVWLSTEPRATVWATAAGIRNCSRRRKCLPRSPRARACPYVLTISRIQPPSRRRARPIGRTASTPRSACHHCADAAPGLRVAELSVVDDSARFS